MLGRLWQQTYLSDNPRTRRIAQQTIFAVVLGAAVIGILVFRPEAVQSTALWLGVALLFGATVAAVAVPWTRFDRRCEVILPMVDLAAIGCVRTATLPEGATLSFLTILVAVWLAIGHRRLGVILAVVASLLTITAPSILVSANPTDPIVIVRNLLLPLVVLMMCIMVLGLFTRLEDARTRAEQLSEQQKKERDEVARIARLLTDVGESLNVGVLVIDAAGNDLMFNQAQRDIHALVSPAANRDRTEAGHLIFYPDGKTPIPAERRPAYRAAHGESFENMLVYAGPPGLEQRAISVTARTVTNEKGERGGSVLVMYDVTEMREAMRAREEFVAAVSHELRTPLTSILGYADLALEASDENLVMDYLGVIDRNAEQLLSIVEDLLIEQQGKFGQLVLHARRVRISALATRAVKSLQPLATEKDIALIDRSNETPVMVVDPSRITQVFENLIANAVKYTQAGGTVVVTTSVHGASVEFTVTDDGPGLDPEDAARLFTPFFRARTAHSSPVSGSGLGLTIVKSITEAHGGFVAVESAPGQGTTCRVLLPAGSAKEAE